MSKILILLFFLFPLTLFGQSIDVETEKFCGVKKLTVKTYYGCFAKENYRYVYSFDKKGNAIKLSNFCKKNHHVCFKYKYKYNDKGLLEKETQTYNINKKHKLYTKVFTYEFDTNDLLICKTEYFGWKSIEYYQDFDTNNNPQTIISIYNNLKTITNQKFNANGKEILITEIKNDTIISTKKHFVNQIFNPIGKEISREIIKNDTIISIERYNEFGDIIYSHLPYLLDKETGKMAVLIGGNRHSVVEEYEYLYDKFNRWIEKYVIYDGKKMLLEKRIFK